MIMEKQSNSQKPTTNMDQEKVRNERQEYFEKLRNWLDDARLWYSLAAGFPNALHGMHFPDGGVSNPPNPGYVFPQTPMAGPHDGARFRNNQPSMMNLPNNATINGVPLYQTYPFILPPNLLRLPTTFEFKIPPLWKRLCAEFIDFCILFAIKIGLTFFFMESFSIGNALELYGIDLLQKGILEGQEMNFALASELVLLEFLHRFIVCAFETYFLQGKTCATPGKRCMGIMVVNVESLMLIPNRSDTVCATGVKAVGWQRALLRSVLKNLIVGLLLPLCLSFYMFPFNRTNYDMMANTLVVEAHPEFLLYQALR